MTATDKDWLWQKQRELERHARLGHDVTAWDALKFLVIIGQLNREIRRYKTALAAKVGK